MGGGSSKDAQLQKLGQLFSAQERQCLNRTFHAIAGYEEATFFSKDELQVLGLPGIVYCPIGGFHKLFFPQ